MPIISLPDGTNAEFPDSMPLNEIKSVIQRKFPPQNTQSLSEQPSGLQNFKNAIGADRTALDNVQDIGAGLLRGGQNIVATLGEGGQWAGNKLMENPFMQMLAKKIQGATGISVPEFNVREELTHDDLGKKFASKNPNSLAVLAGQYAPAVLLGGPGLAGQAVANGLYGATQSEPGQRIKNALIEGGGIYGAGKIIPPIYKGTKAILNKTTSKDVATAIQDSHDKLKKYSTDLFDLVSKETKIRGIDQVPVPHNLINDVAEYLPKTRKTQNLLDKAKEGNYSDLRKLQSELWQRGTAHLSSRLPTDHMAGEEILDLREKINESIGNYFEKSGHEDLNHLLSEAKNSYADLKRTYFGNKVSPKIKNLVHEETRRIPKNIKNILLEDSKPMERIRNANPLIMEKFNALKDKENALKKLGISSGIGAGALGLNWGYNQLKNALQNK